MKIRRLLLVMLLFALPLQGALATSRLCLALMHAPATADHADDAHQHHAPAGGDHDSPAHPAGGNDHHAAGSCSLCAACSLTVAAAPDAPHLAPTLATFAAPRPFTVPVPHNVADGLERPPRTI